MLSATAAPINNRPRIAEGTKISREVCDRRSIGSGMIPRGEVGLIFANLGLGMSIGGVPVVDQGLFATIVLMVLVTTVITPPALKWSLARGRHPDAPAAAPAVHH